MRCFVCSFTKIRGAIALLLEPAKAVEQTHVLDVLQNQKRESAVLFSSKQGSFQKSERGKFCSRCLFFDGCKHFDFYKTSDRKTMFQNVVSSVAVSKRIFASLLTGKFCSKCFCFLQAKQSPVFVGVSRPTMNSPVRR